MTMDAREKVVQYLDEARGHEVGLVRELQAQIAMTPRGSYRSLLEKHLRETRSQAERLRRRLDELDHGQNPLELVGGVAQMVVGQALSIGRAPLAMIRGTGGEEKVLKNAKDSCAAEALEIATYIALEQVARAVDDERTAELAAGIRAEEERMLERLHAELPKLADRVVRADIHGDPTYDLGKTGAADTIRETAEEVKQTAKNVGQGAKKASRQARKVPGVAQAEGEIKGALANEEDLPIANYDDLNVEEINSKLGSLSQIDLAKVDAYERRESNRTTVLDKVDALRGDEPWPGYDEQNVGEITSALRATDDENVLEQVRTYERAHKARSSVLKATERKLAAVS